MFKEQPKRELINEEIGKLRIEELKMFNLP
jgi:hypothetical protein